MHAVELVGKNKIDVKKSTLSGHFFKLFVSILILSILSQILMRIVSIMFDKPRYRLKIASVETFNIQEFWWDDNDYHIRERYSESHSPAMLRGYESISLGGYTFEQTTNDLICDEMEDSFYSCIEMQEN